MAGDPGCSSPFDRLFTYPGIYGLRTSRRTSNTVAFSESLVGDPNWQADTAVATTPGHRRHSAAQPAAVDDVSSLPPSR